MLIFGKTRILYLLLFVSLLVLFFSGGGLFVTFAEDHVQTPTAAIAILGAVAIAAFCSALLCCRFLLRNTSEVDHVAGTPRRKQLVFSLVLFIMLVASTLLLSNFTASFFVVPWPMSGLHGVSSAVGKQAWEFKKDAVGFVKVNSWGQRDREHTLIPQPRTYRMIFIGDSFLEEGAPVPLPYRTEQILNNMGQTSYELINLGVSATDPDEYFFRLKRVGLSLQPNHCILMFSAGSDFIQEPTLLSFGGISATYPRWSFLQLLGLESLDHVISNDRRPLLRAWFKGGSLLKNELGLQEVFGKTANDDETEKVFLSYFPPNEQTQLKSVLYKSSASVRSKFYGMLRHPDGGALRSYYLDIATRIALGMPAPESVAAEYSFRWVKAAYELCRNKGIKFTLVMIPDGFAVDSRMSENYAALADMKSYMKYKDDAASRLVTHAVEAGMDVVDLRGLLKSQPGTYLNMDGHWSQPGVDLVAGYLAKSIMAPSQAESAGKR